MKSDKQRSFLDPGILARLGCLSLEARRPMEGSFAGQHKSPHRGASVEFSQYRDYVPGDDINHLDWRAYARSDRFYIKEFEADTNLRCYLILDCSASMAFGGKLDLSRQLAGQLASLAVRQGDAVGMCCFNSRVVEEIPARTSPRHLKNVYDIIEKVQPQGETDIPTVLHDFAERIRRRAMIIVVSDFFTDLDPLFDCFQHLLHRKHDLAVFHVLDQQETEFQFQRPVRFRDLESNFSMLTDPASIREEYLREFRSFLERIRAGCLQYNVDYRMAITHQGCEPVLSSFLLDRMRRKST